MTFVAEGEVLMDPEVYRNYEGLCCDEAAVRN
jgi:hypothetical protein